METRADTHNKIIFKMKKKTKKEKNIQLMIEAPKHWG